ncbi:GNAT family N-acetyltransferase [Roseateles amylovorans]|uniref:GNAT family N-acetyltransferase n=1 Tax=Roseateles amylovorans TaxID=2978473 RepID=A0ABY6AZB4_9BURK|nr:GNAT family N-acetyltransferase [Roseateles amylovorans]UXH78130.1 GNAT family N-acetyltransferase [Roseateles amylovorans]
MDVLRTARLRLRWFNEADAPFVRELLNEPAWIQHIYDAEVRTDAQAAQWIRERLVMRYWLLGFGFWAVERLSDGELLGLCGVIKRDGLDHPDIGYGFPARCWGHGYAREAAAGTFDYCRQVLGLREVMGTTGPENHASGRVLLAIGLEDEGVQQTAAHEGLSRVYRWRDTQPADDDAQIAALRWRWQAALQGPARAALTACVAPSTLEAVMNGRADLSPPAYDDLARRWAPLAEDVSIPAIRTPAGWRLQVPAP